MEICSHITPQFVVWNDAASFPPALATTSGSDWGKSGPIWIRVKEETVKDDSGNVRVVHPAHSAIGRCIFPKKPVAFDPVSRCDNPATTVTWGDDVPHYELRGVPVDASHWLPIVEPVPPNEPIIPSLTGTCATAIFIHYQN